MRTFSRLAAVMLLVAAASTVALGADVGVTVNGRALTLDQGPVMQGGRVLVPLRGIFEALGATVRYDAASRAIDAIQGSSNVHLTLGSTQATVNGRPVALDVPAQTVGGRAVVPLRFVSEALGAHVAWEATSRMVSVTTTTPPSVTYAPPAPPAPPAPAPAPVVVMPAPPVPPPTGPQPNVFVSVDSPSRGQKVARDFTVTGRTLPFATVSVKAQEYHHTLIVFGAGGDAVEAQGQADASGHFAIPVHMPVQGTHNVNLQVTASDSRGRLSKRVEYGIAVGEP